MRKAPAHAGGLNPWERLAFALAFALMAAFVVVVAVSAAHGREHGGRPAGSAAARPAGSAGSGRPRSVTRTRAARRSTRKTSAAAMNRQLATALAPVLTHHTGHLAVGVMDRAAGVRAVYDGGRRFLAGSIIKADILAALLLQDQQAGTVFGQDEARLAAQMIEYSQHDPADYLWQDAGEADGLAEANADLGLRHTTPGQGSYWGVTSTTVPDQLRLLMDLTSAQSPLTAASRSYELSLMRFAAADQTRGVAAAATAGTASAVLDGLFPQLRLWVVNSIGVIQHGGQQVLVAVLCDGQPTQAAGIAEDAAAAVAAVRGITGQRP